MGDVCRWRVLEQEGSLRPGQDDEQPYPVLWHAVVGSVKDVRCHAVTERFERTLPRREKAPSP